MIQYSWYGVIFVDKHVCLLILVCHAACYFQSGKYIFVGLYSYTSNLSYRLVFEVISAYLCTSRNSEETDGR